MGVPVRHLPSWRPGPGGLAGGESCKTRRGANGRRRWVRNVMVPMTITVINPLFRVFAINLGQNYPWTLSRASVVMTG